METQLIIKRKTTVQPIDFLSEGLRRKTTVKPDNI